MTSIGVNPPKTPVTGASKGVAAATTPNVCKMPGPPAPFVPTPLPNMGRSGDSPGDYTSTVLFEGEPVAVRGSHFMSKGDMASKGTGGGLVSQATHGQTEFVSPGSMNVLAEGKNIQLLGANMTNNGSNPPNGGLTPAEVQAIAALGPLERLQEILCRCKAKVTDAVSCLHYGQQVHDCCEEAIGQVGADDDANGRPRSLGGERGYRSSGRGKKKTWTEIKDSSGKPISRGDWGRHSANPKAGPPPKTGARDPRYAGTGWPDACTIDGKGNPTQFFDFKTSCPQHIRNRSGTWDNPRSSYSSNAANFMVGTKGEGSHQQAKFTEIGNSLSPPVTAAPAVVDDTSCT